MLATMPAPIINSHRGLFLVLFFIFEALFIVSVIVLTDVDFTWTVGWSDIGRTVFWFSFVGLFVVSFLLRRAARYLAVIGWISLFVGFLFTIFLSLA
jgi:hypothetical protein